MFTRRMNFVISTWPFEECSTTKIVLDSNGDLMQPSQDDVDDAQFTQPVSQLSGEMLDFPASRHCDQTRGFCTFTVVSN